MRTRRTVCVWFFFVLIDKGRTEKRRRWKEAIKRRLEMGGKRSCEVENTGKIERERRDNPLVTLKFANKSKVDFMLQLIDVCMSLN